MVELAARPKSTSTFAVCNKAADYFENVSFSNSHPKHHSPRPSYFDLRLTLRVSQLHGMEPKVGSAALW